MMELVVNICKTEQYLTRRSLTIDLIKGRLDFSKLVKKMIMVKREDGSTFKRLQWVLADKYEPKHTNKSQITDEKVLKLTTNEVNERKSLWDNLFEARKDDNAYGDDNGPWRHKFLDRALTAKLKSAVGQYEYVQDAKKMVHKKVKGLSAQNNAVFSRAEIYNEPAVLKNYEEAMYLVLSQAYPTDDIEELHTKLNDIKKYCEDTPVTINFPNNMKCLNGYLEDGNMRNMLDRAEIKYKKSADEIIKDESIDEDERMNLEQRTDVEHNVWKVSEKGYQKRPIYGALNFEGKTGGAADDGNYGEDTYFILKREVKNRSTSTVDDSFSSDQVTDSMPGDGYACFIKGFVKNNGAAYMQKMLKLMTGKQPVILPNNKETTQEEKEDRGYYEYMESQIWGGIDLAKDVQHICYKEPDRTITTAVNKKRIEKADKILEMGKKYGIECVAWNEKKEATKSDTLDISIPDKKSLVIDLIKGRLDFSKLVKKEVDVKRSNGTTFRRLQWVLADKYEPKNKGKAQVTDAETLKLSTNEVNERKGLWDNLFKKESLGRKTNMDYGYDDWAHRNVGRAIKIKLNDAAGDAIRTIEDMHEVIIDDDEQPTSNGNCFKMAEVYNTPKIKGQYEQAMYTVLSQAYPNDDTEGLHKKLNDIKDYCEATPITINIPDNDDTLAGFMESGKIRNKIEMMEEKEHMSMDKFIDKYINLDTSDDPDKTGEAGYCNQRLNVESTLLGIPYKGIQQRPMYGALNFTGNEKGAADGYGHGTHLILKRDVKSRSTSTIEDSFGVDSGVNAVYPGDGYVNFMNGFLTSGDGTYMQKLLEKMTGVEPIIMSKMNPDDDTTSEEIEDADNDHSYYESQIMGDIDLARDVQCIVYEDYNKTDITKQGIANKAKVEKILALGKKYKIQCVSVSEAEATSPEEVAHDKWLADMAAEDKRIADEAADDIVKEIEKGIE